MISLGKKSALFVDMDGTLVDSEGALYRLYEKTLASYGFRGSREEFDELVGPTIPEALAILKKRYGLSLPIDQLHSHYQAALRALYSHEIALFDGAVDFLLFAKERGMAIALVTASSRENVDALFAARGIGHLFDALITPEGERGKPAPDLYYRALKETATSAERALVIEDSPNGVMAALAAEIETVQLFGKRLPEKILCHPLLTRFEEWHSLRSGCEAGK